MFLVLKKYLPLVWISFLFWGFATPIFAYPRKENRVNPTPLPIVRTSPNESKNSQVLGMASMEHSKDIPPGFTLVLFVGGALATYEFLRKKLRVGRY